MTALLPDIPADVLSEVPLSEEQQGLLYLQRLDPGSATYHVPLAFELIGDLHLPALRRALAALARHHPLLTGVPADVTVRCEPSRPVPLTVRTLPGVDPERAARVLADEACVGVDWDAEGLSRAVLVEVAADRNYLLLVVHHLVADGESAGILAADLWRCYVAEHPASAGSPNGGSPNGGSPNGGSPNEPGTDLALRAADAVARAVARRRDGRDEQRLRDYWLGVLADGEPVELPDDGAPDDPFPGTGSVPVELAAGPIGDFARRNRLSVFAVLLAGYQRTVTRYARCRRALVAVPVSTRDDPSLDGVVGCFVNTVLVRSPGDDRLPSVEYVRAVQTEAARAIDHAALPYPRIAELAGDPLAAMTCTFTFQSWHGSVPGEWRAPGLVVRHMESVHQQVVGDLTLELFATGRSVRGRLRYAERRLAPQTAAAFARQLVATVDAMVAGQDTPVAFLPDVPVRADRTDRDFDRGADVDQLLRAAAFRNADRVAVVDGAVSVTYRDLDARVERAAAGLRRRGVTPGDRVGIWLPRGVDQVVAVLATLRAGAVFVAMELEHPEARLASIADRVELAIVIREYSAAPTPGGGPSASVDDLTGPASDGRPDRADQGAAPSPASRAGEPAYVLFTSGSTGVPKGVVVGHRALVNQLCWAHRHFALGPDDVMAYSGTLSFDVTVHQLLAPLTCGARLAVVPQGQQRDPEAMARTMLRQRASVLHIVPALLRLLVEEPAFAENRALRAVISVGEPLTNQLREAFQRIQDATLYNGYGPTEATIYATVFDASLAARQRWTRQVDVPIGHPMDNVRCHLLDEHLRPVPPGAPGELCLAGVALADGYYGDPEQTAARFPTVPLGDGPERVYRTGDLARSLPTGDLSFLGRLDHQVKVNGFRVELGEVEAALLAVAGVRQAVAVVRHHADGHGQLIGYVTPASVREADALAALAAHLPGYMVPARVVALDGLPQLANGKIDRGSLAALPAGAVAAGAVAAATPVTEHGPGVHGPGASPRRRGETVALLRRAWTEVIGTPPVDDRAHFFTSGGDSILAMRLVSALRRAGVRVDLRQVHDMPVLADLAAHLDDAGGHREARPTLDGPPTQAPVWSGPAGTRLAPIQHWFLDTVRTDRHHWNQSVLLDVCHPVEQRILALAVQAVFLAHPTLSTRLVGDRAEPVPPFTAVPARHLMDTVTVGTSQERDEAVAALHRDLNPATGVMFRARYLRVTSGATDQLLLVAHHLVIDGVSWRILLDDLAAAVEALRADELPRLPAETLPYHGWVSGLAAAPGAAEPWLAMVRRRRQAAGTLHSGPAGREGRSRDVEFELERSATVRLLEALPAAVGMGVHEVLTALVAIAIARWRGCGLVTLDVETHGRQTACGDVTRTVGWFTATHPLVVEVDRTSAPLEQLRAVAQELARVPDGGVGFGACLRYAAAEIRAELAAAPAALIGFNYLGRFDRDLPGGVLRIAGQGSAADRSPLAERAHPVEVYGTVVNGTARLGVNWVDAPYDGVDEPAVTALLGQLRSVIDATIADVSPRQVPLNAQQRGMLVDALAHQTTGRYVEQLCWTWRGPMDPTRFRAAWGHAVGLHEALRGRIDRTGTPSMVIEPEIEVPIRTCDGDTAWERVVADDRATGFDLAAAPLWRVTLQPAGGEHRVLLTFHHVLLDGWSVALVVSDFYRAYLGDPRHRTPGAPDLLAHDRWVAGRDRNSARRFWRELLRNTTPATSPGLPPPASALPASAPSARPGTQAGPGRLELRLPDAPLAAASGLAAAAAVTDSTLFQAVWAALLWRFAGGGGDRTVAFGVTFSGRGADLAGVDLLAGMLVTTLPLVVTVRPDEPLLELAHRIRDRMLDIAPYEWASTGEVHDWSGRGGGEPLFESLLVHENYPQHLGATGASLDAEGITVNRPEALGAQTGYPCTLLVHRDARTFVLTIVYDGVVVDDAAARRLAELWLRCGGVLGHLATTTVAGLTGTFDDAELPRLAAKPAMRPATDDDTPGTWPAGRHTPVVRDAWQRLLGVADVDPRDNFFSAGGHSLLASHLVSELNERCGVAVRLDDLLTNPTAGGFAAVVEALAATVNDAVTVDAIATVDDTAATRRRSPLVTLAPGRHPILYLVHPPGGHVACYGEFASHYDGPGGVVGVRDPRLDLTGPPRQRGVDELAKEYTDLLLRQHPDGRFSLGGYSGGGLIAYEIAQTVHAATSATPLVVLLDTPAPTGEVTDTAADGSFLSLVTAYDRHRRTGEPLDERLAGNAYLTELAAVSDWMSETGQGDPFALLALTLDAVERHRPRPYPGPVVVCRATDTDFGTGTSFESGYARHRTDSLGWDVLCPRLSVHTVPGNHVSMLTGEHAETLARAVSEIIRRHHGGQR